MKSSRSRFLALFTGALALLAASAPCPVLAQETKGALEGITLPKPDVPEIFTGAGEFVRQAYNNEGYVVLSYRMVQQEAGNPWVLLTVGITLRSGVKYQKLTRGDLTLTTPDGKTIALATQQEYMADASLRALDKRAMTVRDSIDYFPVGVNRPCAIKFFADMSKGVGLAFDEVELSDNRACMGRIYFNVPGGIQVGQHWLNVKFAGSVVKVPFRVFTKEEEKEFHKKWEDIKKELDATYK